jgi:hypothetical protein
MHSLFVRGSSARALSLGALLLVACNTASPGVSGPPPIDAGAGSDGAPPTIDGGNGTAPTYYGEVDDLLATHCWRCHSSTGGGIAPFVLDTYESASAAAGAIAVATRARIMPPFFAVNDGTCQAIDDHGGWLTDAEIGTLAAWAAAGAPEGVPDAMPPAHPSSPHVTSPSVRIQMPEPFTQSLSPNEIRCFVADPGVTSDAYITAYEVLPGTPAVVHHVIVYEPETDADAASAAAMAGTDGRPGYACSGGPIVPAHPVALWAPGAYRTAYPEGTGLLLPAHRQLVIQVHYNDAAGAPQADQTAVVFETTPSVTRPAQMMLINQTNISLPPHMASVSTAPHSLRVPGAASIWGVFPHMHVTGQHLGLTLDHAGATSCIVDVERWSFNWQQAYFFTSPISVTAGDRVSIQCEYDTSSRDVTTTFGEGTEDEMCLSFAYVTAS